MSRRAQAASSEQMILPMLGTYWGWLCPRCGERGKAEDHEDALRRVARHVCEVVS